MSKQVLKIKTEILGGGGGNMNLKKNHNSYYCIGKGYTWCQFVFDTQSDLIGPTMVNIATYNCLKNDIMSTLVVLKTEILETVFFC